MQRTLILALFAGFTVLAFAKPALAMPSTTTSQFNENNATGVIYVGRNDRNWRNKNYKGTTAVIRTGPAPIIGVIPLTGRTPPRDILITTGDPGSA